MVDPPTTNNKLEPVYVKNSENLVAKWLQVKQETVIPTREGNPDISTMLANPLPPEQKIVFNILEPNQYQCKKCCATFQAGEGDPEICPACERPSTFIKTVDGIDMHKNLWRLPVWIDEDPDMLNTYIDLINLLKKTIRFVEEIHYKIFALWIIATYKHPEWETIPYLHFKGLPASGKTRAMEMANLLAYRCVMVSSITFTAIVRVNHNYNVTLLIDEIDTKTDERTEVGREYVDFLKSGYKKGSMYISSDLNDQKKVLYYNNYGPKILTGEKGIYSEALLSRTITFEMEQDFPDIFNLPEVFLECDQIKTKLLNYRFKTATPEHIGEEISLRARYREIFDCLIRTARHIGQPCDDLVKFAKDMEEQTVADMQGTLQWDVLNALYESSCQGTLDAPEGVKLSTILEKLDMADEAKKNAQRLGYVIKNFGLITKKKRDCTWLSFVEPKNEHKLKYLFKRYRIGGGPAE